MKTTRFISTCAAILLGIHFLLAGEPQSNKTSAMATRMVEKLNADVALTDSQKAVLAKAATSYLENRRKAAQKNGDETLLKKKQAQNIFRATLDSLLTPDQQAQLEIKRELRRQAAANGK